MGPTAKPEAERLFAGPGPIRTFCRTVDWRSTPFGAVTEWPQSLRTAVDLCLGSTFPGFLWWGAELGQIYNDAAVSILAAKHPQIFAKPAREAWSDLWHMIGPVAERVLSTGEPYRAEDVVLVPDRVNPYDESRFNVSCAALRDEDAAVAGIFIIATETTSATRAALRRQLAVVEEEERRRLSRELHDEIGQHLTALGLGLRALSDVASPGSDVDRRASQLQALATTLGRELHAVALRLRPKALDDFGLEAALSAYAEEWSRHSGIAVDIHARADAERLPGAVESAIYRIVQEALTNIARHSGASRASVVVERRDGQIVTVVEDDGRGFDVDALSRAPSGSGGLGLLGVRERAALLRGTVEIESAPGSSTALFVRIPIDRTDDRRDV